jgi:hypothetical protein
MDYLGLAPLLNFFGAIEEFFKFLHCRSCSIDLTDLEADFSARPTGKPPDDACGDRCGDYARERDEGVHMKEFDEFRRTAF